MHPRERRAAQTPVDNPRDIRRELSDHKTTYMNTHHVVVQACEDPNQKQGHPPSLYRIEVWGEPLEPHVTELEFHVGDPTTPNGITTEALLAVVLDRLRVFQAGPLRDRQNALTITKLEEALLWQLHRTREREAKGVAGTSTPTDAGVSPTWLETVEREIARWRASPDYNPVIPLIPVTDTWKSHTVAEVTGVVARRAFPFPLGPFIVLDHENDVLVVRVVDAAKVNAQRLTTQKRVEVGLYGFDFELLRTASPTANAEQVLCASEFVPVSTVTQYTDGGFSVDLSPPPVGGGELHAHLVEQAVGKSTRLAHALLNHPGGLLDDHPGIARSVLPVTEIPATPVAVEEVPEWLLSDLSREDGKLVLWISTAGGMEAVPWQEVVRIVESPATMFAGISKAIRDMFAHEVRAVRPVVALSARPAAVLEPLDHSLELRVRDACLVAVRGLNNQRLKTRVLEIPRDVWHRAYGKSNDGIGTYLGRKLMLVDLDTPDVPYVRAWSEVMCDHDEKNYDALI